MGFGYYCKKIHPSLRNVQYNDQLNFTVHSTSLANDEQFFEGQKAKMESDSSGVRLIEYNALAISIYKIKKKVV